MPGPTATQIVANSLSHGLRAGLANVLGTQAGLAVFIAVLAVGLSLVIAAMGVWFDWLLFFGAFIPQFIDPAGEHTRQIALLGATAMACALVFDTAYALLTARSGRFISARRLRRANQASGLFLIGGGLWRAFSREK